MSPYPPLRRRSLAATWLAVAALLGPVASRAAQTSAYVVTTDFATGGVSAVDLATRAVSPDVSTVHSDAICRWYQNRLYVVNRFGAAGDNLQVLDPAAGFATVLQFSTGNGSNPQDIAFVSPTKAYVSRYDDPSLLVVDPTTGAAAGPAIPLAHLDPADGNPEAFRMIRVGRYVFVSLQRLVGFVASDTSLVAVVDTEADTLVDVDPLTPGAQSIVLTGTNPATSFAYDADGRRVLVGCVGQFGVADGGIEAFDPHTFQSLGNLIGEAALGGDIVDFEWSSPAKSYAIVSDVSFNTTLVSWSETSSSVLQNLYAPGGFSLADIALNDRGELYVANNSFLAPGLFVFSTASDLQIAGPLDTGLPPFHICFDASSNDVVSVPASAAPISFSGPWPNPVSGTARFRLSLARSASVRIEAFDVSGRVVRTLEQGELDAGTHVIAWNLADHSGRRLRAGVYWIAAQVEGNRFVKRMAVLW